MCADARGAQQGGHRAILRGTLSGEWSVLIKSTLASADGLHLQVTGSSDKTIRQWDVATGQCILTMDILWAISNPPESPTSSTRPTMPQRSSTSFGSIHYDDLLPTPGASLTGLSGASLLSAATSQNFSVPTPPYSDGSWEMYQDFVGGLQFWGYALASGSGDGGVRMWDSEPGLANVLDPT